MTKYLLFKRYQGGYGNEYDNIHGPFESRQDAIEYCDRVLKSLDIDIDEPWGCKDYFIDTTEY
jgi:hypothetical protein